MFPLGTVLLPFGALPLHVFEPRYRALVERVVQGDDRFGVVLIERGSEVGGDDVRSDVGCLAEIREVQAFDDGRYALIAVGTERIRVTEWLPDDPHPWALTVEWPHEPPEATHEEADRCQALLRSTLARKAELGEAAAPATLELDAPPDVVVDLAASLAPIGPLDKQVLLRCPDRSSRASRLAAMLSEEVEVLDARIRFR